MFVPRAFHADVIKIIDVVGPCLLNDIKGPGLKFTPLVIGDFGIVVFGYANHFKGDDIAAGIKIKAFQNGDKAFLDTHFPGA